MGFINFKKLNTLLAGILIGVLLPAALYFIFIMPKMAPLSIIGKQYSMIIIKFLPLFLSRCIFPNALLFFLLIWKNQMNIAKGVLISTAVLTSVLLFISFIL
ncbi:MAG: hypothetical protein JXB24_11815 [Bacteroidales bacterium]|nr:hypothetical protein [Bacteroidales bacterium]